MPRIDLILDALEGSEWFATLDLQSGYWQVEMDPDSREKTAFSFGQGLWEFQVMPFGLCNASATFQRLMEDVLRGLPSWCLVYLDDFLVHAPTFNELLDHLQQVFRRLENAGLKLATAKCHLCRREVKFLGHLISAEGISPDPGKVGAVNDWPTPLNVTNVQSFLGLCAYYRRFIKDFSKIARPLHQLCEKGKRFEWSGECQEAFTNIKELLTSAPILIQPRWEQMFILDTDASLHAMGAVLSQRVEGKEHVVAFYSKTFNRAERNYCVTRRELLAVVRATKHFRHYLLGRRFLLRTDHASLRWLTNFREPEGQVARWIQLLQEFDFELCHRAGTCHGNADALSRRPCQMVDCIHCHRLDERARIAVRLTSVVDDFATRQLEDPVLQTIHDWLIRQERPTREDMRAHSPELKAYWSMWSSLFLCDGKICRHTSQTLDGHHQLLVPKKCIPDILKLAHDSPTGGHFGVQKTTARVKKDFYWIDCATDIERHCLSCSVCASRHGPRKKQRSPLQIDVVGAPFERVAVDILGPLPKTDRNNQYVLVLMDYFTKWPEALAIPDITAETVAEACVYHVFSRFGAPRLLHSDQGRNFESAVFQAVLQLFGVDKTRTTALHPQSDGMVERFNRTILDYLAKFVDEHQRNWDTFLPLLMMSYRSTVHQSTKQTPAMLLFGRELRIPTTLVYGSPPDAPISASAYVNQLLDRLHEVHNYATQNLKEASRKMKDRYDIRVNTKPFAEGNLVWLYNPKRRVGRCPKLQRNWEGPYVITKQISDVVYTIQKPGKAKLLNVHRDRLASFRGDPSTQL